MNCGHKLYEKGDYIIQKSINLENELYTRLKEIVDKKYDTTLSEMVNICIENLIGENNIKYYARAERELPNYRSLMLRKSNIDKLHEINHETGIAVTRLINMSIKNFLDKYDYEET